MTAICWGSLAIQTLAFVYSAAIQARVKPPENMRYFAKDTRRYYRIARGIFLFQGAMIVVWCYAMMRVLHLAK